MDKIFFIVGIGRSGTTLLQSMLNAHPLVACPPESHFVKNYLAPQFTGNFKNPTSKQDLITLLKSDEDLGRLGIDLDACVNASVDLNNKYFFGDLFTEILNQYLTIKKKIHAGEKDPLNIGFLRQIKQAYPEAYVINLIRDPRDVILSRTKTDWGEKYPFLVHIAEYRYYMHKAMREGPKIFGPKYIELLYEKLIENPEAELNGLCTKLGIGFDEQMLEYFKHSEGLVSGSEMQWKGNIFRPVDKANKEKWRKGLSPFRVKRIEGAVSGIMKKFNYRLEYKDEGFSLWILSIPAKFLGSLYSIKKIFR